MLQEVRLTKELVTDAENDFFAMKRSGVLGKVGDNVPTHFVRGRLVARRVFKKIFPDFVETDNPFVFRAPDGESVDIRALIVRNRPNETYHVLAKGPTNRRPPTFYFFFVAPDFSVLWLAGWKHSTYITNRHVRQQGERSRSRPGVTYQWPCFEFRVSELKRTYLQKEAV